MRPLPSPRLAALLFAIAFCGLAFSPGESRSAQAPATNPMQQMERNYPSRAYYTGFTFLWEGDYRDALDLFQTELKGGFKTGLVPWVDSICYHTMIGESYFQIGDNAKALVHFTAALNLFLTHHQDWMIRVQFSPVIRPAFPGAVKRVPWGSSKRQAPVGQFPTTMLVSKGRIDNNDTFRRGGVVDLAKLYPLDVKEVVRCLTLAIRRRAVLLGPTCASDSVTAEMVNALMRRPGPPNHWSEAWIDIQLGLSLVAAGKDAQGVTSLQRSILAGGQFDHPLTATALLELGRLALSQNNHAAAMQYFEEATYAAANFYDPMLMEEAFRLAIVAHFAANQPGLYPPLLPAIAWAKREGLKHLQASLVLLAAENCLVVGQTRDAARLMEEARQVLVRRHMSAARMGARYHYVNAISQYQQRRVAEGDTAVGQAMAYMRNSSLWLYHIRQVDDLAREGKLTDRGAVQVLRFVLRDPTPADWMLDPMEAMAVTTTARPGPMERWYDAAMRRKDVDAALEISERVRQHRFFTSLTLGGRLQALRWLLAAPEEMLPQTAKVARQDLLVRYPAFGQRAEQARKLVAGLRSAPLVPTATDAQHAQKEALAQLGLLSALQEALLREIAVRREAIPILFPPVRTLKEMQMALPKGHAVLTFFTTSSSVHAFLFNGEQSHHWEIQSPPAVYKRTVELLRQMGQQESNREMSAKELADKQWKSAAQQLLVAILQGSQADLADPALKELIIVPDSVFWYVPFEALQVEVDKQLQPLVGRIRIRYLPLASLAVPDVRARRPVARTAVSLGPLFAKDSEPASRAAAEAIGKVLPGTSILSNPLLLPSPLMAALMDRLIVFDQIAPDSPYGWPLIPADRSKNNTLDDWLALPWEGPEELILPGFHTAAENALKRISTATAGQEVFLSVCGMMSTGARTILLSRWRTAGQSCYDLVREFVQELPHTTPSEAWQRSVLLLQQGKLDPAAEPRIRRGESEDRVTPEHPMFWAGYMLVDSAGGIPSADEGPAQPAVPPVTAKPAAAANGAGAPAAGAVVVPPPAAAAPEPDPTPAKGAKQKTPPKKASSSSRRKP